MTHSKCRADHDRHMDELQDAIKEITEKNGKLLSPMDYVYMHLLGEIAGWLSAIADSERDIADALNRRRG